MKKKNLTALKLKKTSISKLSCKKGGIVPPPPPGLTTDCFTLYPECTIPTGDSHIVCETQQLECYIFTLGC